MRLFTNLDEAASEIKRDLAKSPVVRSHRVQNLLQAANVHEALDYSYSVIEIPESVEDIAFLGAKLGLWDNADVFPMQRWLLQERQARMKWEPGAVTEKAHPHLAKLNETTEPEYTYTDRLRGALQVLADTICQDETTRRAFWPIFQPEDSVRSSRVSRIPCSLGYQALVRMVGDVPHLHLTYLERSCDFNKFWLTDIWFARQFQLQLLSMIRNNSLGPVRCGNTTHFITSFHAFIDDEVY